MHYKKRVYSAGETFIHDSQLSDCIISFTRKGVKLLLLRALLRLTFVAILWLTLSSDVDTLVLSVTPLALLDTNDPVLRYKCKTKKKNSVS